MEKKIHIKSEAEMIELGKLIGEKLDRNYVITLSGDLGAGKTTLTKGIGQALEVDSIINSPTFTILKIHNGKIPLYHMDVYRIGSDTGDDSLEEFFELDGVSVIEWAENIEYLLPDELLQIKIEILEDGTREVSLNAFGNKYKKIVEEVNR